MLESGEPPLKLRWFLECFFVLCPAGNGKVSSCAAAEGSFTALTGLLEVEPLHFTCISTSDGTRVERDDASMFTGKRDFFHFTFILLWLVTWPLSDLLLFNPSEYIWHDAGSGRSVDRNGWWSVYSSELCSPGGSPVTVPCHGVCGAAAAGPAGETAAAVETAAAGDQVSHTQTQCHFSVWKARVLHLKWANGKSNSKKKSADMVRSRLTLLHCPSSDAGT